MKNFIQLISCLLVGLSLSACGGPKEAPISEEQFNNLMVEFKCYEKQNPKVSQIERSKKLLQIAKEKNIEFTDQKEFTRKYFDSLKVYMRNFKFLNQIGDEVKQKNCQ
jgi:hypothetical protein